MISPIVSLISAIISGVLATIITITVSHYQESLRFKRTLASDLFGYRYQISNRSVKGLDGKEFVIALNRVPIVFNGCKGVLDSYNRLYAALSIPAQERINEDVDVILIVFLKEICKASKIKTQRWSDETIKGTFNL